MSIDEALDPRRVIAATDESLEHLASQLDEMAAELHPGESFVDYAARRPAVIRENVATISALIQDADAFDVLELMRLKETPLLLTGFRESLAESVPAVVDLIALVLIARGSRSPQLAVPGQANPAGAAEELSTRARTLLRAGTFSAFEDGRTNRFGPLTFLAAEYRQHDLQVKFKQYGHIHDHFNSGLFDTDSMDKVLLGHLGFTYADFLAVRVAIREVYLDGFERARDLLGEVASEWETTREAEDDPGRTEEGLAALSDLLIYPGKRASFTAQSLGDQSRVSQDRVDAILRLFSVGFDSRLDAVEIVEAYLDGRSPFRRAALLRDEKGNYLTLNVPIGTDCFRQVVEDALKETKAWAKYDKHRMKVSEGLAVGYVESLVGVPASHKSLRYYRPREGVATTGLGPTSTNIVDLADQTEADAMFLIEDVAICVEVKGRSVSTAAREGSVQRLTRDLEATIGGATDQAHRLEQLVRNNGGIWLEDRTWLDLRSVREVRSIAVCLDDMGPLGTGLDELVRADVVAHDQFPWITSLHDLAIISEVLDRPAEFLLYLRRRTEPAVSLRFGAVDELDLFMLFVDGGLYVEPDPDAVFAAYPAAGRPTEAMRRRFRRDRSLTRVHTHTDPLDAWIYFCEDSVLEESPKPSFRAEDGLLSVVDFLLADHKPGWFRFSADLLNLSADAQAALSKRMAQLASRTRNDRKLHSDLSCFPGPHGFPTLAVICRPPGMSSREAAQILTTYMVAKKHQLQSDRCLGVILSHEGRIVGVQYANNEPSEDPDLDELGEIIGLQPVGRMARPVPPAARRATKRLRGKRSKR